MLEESLSQADNLLEGYPMQTFSLKNRRGFTLMELLIVIIVIAVLAAIALPRFINSGLRSKEASLKSDLKIYRNAVQLFVNDTGAYPKDLNSLSATKAPASGVDASGATKAIVASDWKGPYIDEIMDDPVSANPFKYTKSSPNVGKITSSAPGKATDGTSYSTW